MPNTCKRQPGAFQRIRQGKMSYSFCAGLTPPGGLPNLIVFTTQTSVCVVLSEVDIY